MLLKKKLNVLNSIEKWHKLNPDLLRPLTVEGLKIAAVGDNELFSAAAAVEAGMHIKGFPAGTAEGVVGADTFGDASSGMATKLCSSLSN